jgi:hypothetical protein
VTLHIIYTAFSLLLANKKSGEVINPIYEGTGKMIVVPRRAKLYWP